MTTRKFSIQFHMGDDDLHRLEGLPWQFPLEEWLNHGVQLLLIRRGESRHPVVFVESEGVRYAIKETTPHMAEREIHNLHEIERRGIPALNHLGFSLLSMSGETLHHVATVLPGWYQRRIHQLLHIDVPRIYARRFYNMILGHQAIMSENEKRDVPLEEAAQDWYTRYHVPTLLLLRRHLTNDQNPLQAYFSVVQHKWDMSKKAGYEVPLEDAILDWSMQRADTGTLGAVDPATVATWWHERQPVANALEPPLLESEELESLVSTGEKPLVRLRQPELEQQLPDILEQSKQTD